MVFFMEVFSLFSNMQRNNKPMLCFLGFLRVIFKKELSEGNEKLILVASLSHQFLAQSVADFVGAIIKLISAILGKDSCPADGIGHALKTVATRDDLFLCCIVHLIA